MIGDNNQDRTLALCEYAERYCDGALSAEQTAEFERDLRGDPSALESFLLYMEVHSRIAWNLRALGVEDHEASEPPLAISPLSPLPSPLSPQFIGGPVFSYMVATVVLCLMLLGAWAYKITHDRNIFTANSRRSTTSGSLDQPELVFVGRITGMKDCRWSDTNTQTVVGAAVSLDREYALASGLMEITYKSGARVILEGPCTYKVESSASGFLERGKLTANIRGQRSEVRGQKLEHYPLSTTHYPLFSVRTPTAVVTDLGTEFGVEVDENGQSRTHVFVGSVRMTGIVPGGAAGKGRIITAGQNGIVDAGDAPVRVVAGEPIAFVRKMPETTLNLADDPYAQLVMSLDPAVYYRMERSRSEKNRTMAYDSASGGRHGILRTLGKADDSAAKSEAAPLKDDLQSQGDASKTQDACAVPSFSTSAKAGNYSLEFTRGRHGLMDAGAAFSSLLITDGFSCSCWFKVVGEDQYFGRIVDMRAESVNWSGLSIYIDQSAKGDMDGDPGTIGLDLDYSITKGGLLPIQYVPDAVTVDKWCHMVVTSSAQYWSDKASGYVTDVTLYLNGKRIAGGTEYAVGGTLSFGNHAGCLQSRQSKHDREFGGLIDEAAVFHRVLNLDEIRRLYQGQFASENQTDAVITDQPQLERKGGK